jgi:YegS/Rv2252/BmrU family lipid kinase
VTASLGKAVVIVNVRAGRFGRDPARLEALLGAAGLEFVVRPTRYAGHAVELAREAVEEGDSFLVAVGGDGTIQEVVNGMMGPAGPHNPEAVLGILSAGSGSDFTRTFELPRRPADAVATLAGTATRAVDLGRVTYTQDGETRSRYFVNIAQAGIGGDIAERAQRLPRPLGRARYLVGFGLGLTAFAVARARITFDDREIVADVTDLIVANAQYFGGGMRIVPGADSSDAMLDVLVVRGRKRDYVAVIGKLYRGRHLPSPHISEHRARRIEIDASLPLRVEADGEVLGTTPAVFEVLGGALRLKI